MKRQIEKNSGKKSQTKKNNESMLNILGFSMLHNESKNESKNDLTSDIQNYLTSDIKNEFPKAKVFIGGAPVNNEFCKNIGADFYAPDPQGIVEYLNTIAS